MAVSKRVWRSSLGALTVLALLAGCGSASSSSTATTVPRSRVTPDVATAPVRQASTGPGAIGYREVGHGPPLVLVMGFGASMDEWAPAFVDALAARHRVVVFDNAGIGRTVALPSPLTITAMADQTSDLITALHLGRTDVVGWSMGGMIAQALAVRHPAQVARVVLAATQPGTGESLPVPAAAAAALDSSNPATKLGVLFPLDQETAVRAYVAGILRYPGRYDASPAIVAAQGAAIGRWLGGTDPAGPATARIGRPTLVADGAVDQLDPVANDHLLAATIPRAQLVLYPDAGHAFLFQDAAVFVLRVETFLASSPA